MTLQATWIISVFDIGNRQHHHMQEVDREILLSFWKVHILHHAGEQPVHGQWIAAELRRHGYEISSGTLYPLLGRLARRGWLSSLAERGGGPRARRDYRLTPKGKKVLNLLQEHIKELHDEVVESGRKERHRRARIHTNE